MGKAPQKSRTSFVSSRLSARPVTTAVYSWTVTGSWLDWEAACEIQNKIDSLYPGSGGEDGGGGGEEEGLNNSPESFAFSTILSKFEVTSSVSLRAQTKRIVKDSGQLHNVLWPKMLYFSNNQTDLSPLPVSRRT